MIVLKKKCFNIPSGFRIIVIFVVEEYSGHGVFTEPRPLFVQGTPRRGAATKPPRTTTHLHTTQNAIVSI